MSFKSLRPLSPLILLALLLGSCVPPDPNAGKDTPVNKVSVDVRNRNVQRLLDLRDRHQTDSLLNYLHHPEATFRYLAALSFVTPRDSNAVSALSPLLRDPVEDVRIAAAFALGQIGAAAAESALIAGFVARDSLSEHQRLNAVILEAVGKCGTAASLRHIAAVTTYQPSDTLLLQGQCRAVYRFGARKITDPSGTALMLRYLTNEAIPNQARLLAAHYFARTEGLVPDSAQAVQLAAAFVRATDPDVRMALAKGLGKSTSGPAFGLLSKVLVNNYESDWRVKCNIVNALQKFNYDTVRALVTPLISDPNVHVSRTAAEFFIANGQAKDGDYYWRIARNNPNLPWQSQVALYHASNRWLSGRDEPESKGYINYRLREIFLNSQNPYERAACLMGLAEQGIQCYWIHDHGFADPHPAVKSAAVEALRTIGDRRDFYGIFGEDARAVRRALYYYHREAIATGDVGMIAGASEALRSEVLNYRTYRDSARIESLTAAFQKLKMPRDVEAIQALEKTLAYFTDQPAPKPSVPTYNHPIDWNFYTTYNPGLRAVVQTPKGSFTLQFFPEWAPGSVANFAQLARDGFFDNKTFHRVVPNFVVQGGCPRGDGYGALDYSIRSELGPVWYDDEGWVGMASAGFDTEGTQWFVTHSPTPHLDGRYTIFARVVQGMDVVHQLQVGDLIQKVELTNAAKAK